MKIGWAKKAALLTLIFLIIFFKISREQTKLGFLALRNYCFEAFLENTITTKQLLKLKFSEF